MFRIIAHYNGSPAFELNLSAVIVRFFADSFML